MIIYILTDDNPRFENPKLIRNQIKKGLKKKNLLKFPQEQKLFQKLVSELNSGDILIVAGKGHENYQEYKKKNFFQIN